MSADQRNGGRSAASPISDVIEAWMSALGLLAGGGQPPSVAVLEELFQAWATMFVPGSQGEASRTESAAESPRRGSDPQSGARAGRAEPSSQGVEQGLQMLASWAQLWAQWVGQMGLTTSPVAPSQRPDRSVILAGRGYAACHASYLRYLFKAADIWGQYCRTTSGRVAESGPEGRSTQENRAYDECAAALREASDRFLQEARLEVQAVQQQLLELAREAPKADEKLDARRRYAKAKP